MAESNLKKENRPSGGINIGIVIFAFILLYLVIKIVIYFTKNEISIYEVPAGYVYSKETYNGFIIRSEEIFYTDSAGYVNYYFLEGDRVQKDGAVYSIGTDKNIYNYLSEEDAEIRLSNDALVNLKSTVSELYRNCETREDYLTLLEKISTVYSRQLDREVLENLNSIIKKSGGISGFKVVTSSESGYVSYYVDSYCDTTADDIDGSYFTDICDSVYVYSSDMITINSPVYKMVTSNDWTIVILIDEEMYKRLDNLNKVSIIINDTDTLSVNISTEIRNSEFFCIINLDKYVMRYSDCRILDIVFDLKDEEGLKIPVSSLVYREYYRIPDNYFIKNDDGNWTLTVENYNQDTGVLQKISTEVEIFYSADGYKYVDAEQISENKYIFDKDENNKTGLNTFKILIEGVYNVNNGYAVFKRIERISENDGYVIIESNTTAGLSIYDHISVNGADCSEGMVIY